MSMLIASPSPGIVLFFPLAAWLVISSLFFIGAFIKNVIKRTPAKKNIVYLLFAVITAVLATLVILLIAWILS